VLPRSGEARCGEARSGEARSGEARCGPGRTYHQQPKRHIHIGAQPTMGNFDSACTFSADNPGSEDANVKELACRWSVIALGVITFRGCVASAAPQAEPKQNGKAGTCAQEGRQIKRQRCIHRTVKKERCTIACCRT
jgi:hypothetical protein